jgi:hypothetical protein
MTCRPTRPSVGCAKAPGTVPASATNLPGCQSWLRTLAEVMTPLDHGTSQSPGRGGQVDAEADKRGAKHSFQASAHRGPGQPVPRPRREQHDHGAVRPVDDHDLDGGKRDRRAEHGSMARQELREEREREYRCLRVGGDGHQRGPERRRWRASGREACAVDGPGNAATATQASRKAGRTAARRPMSAC